MNNQRIDFYLNRECIEIVDRLEDISNKLHKIANEFRKAEIILEEEKRVEILEKIKTNVRANRK